MKPDYARPTLPETEIPLPPAVVLEPSESNVMSQTATMTTVAQVEQKTRRMFWVGLSTVLVVSLVGMVGAIVAKTQQQTNLANQDKTYTATDIPLSELKQITGNELGQISQLTVNGYTQINGALVLGPSEAPNNPTAGQLYYDKAANTVFYYNGEQFRAVVDTSNTVASVGGATGAIALGNGLVMANGTLSSTVQGGAQLPANLVNSIQGQTGVVTFSAGDGIGLVGTVISNSGVKRLGGVAGDITIGTGLAISGQTLSSTTNITTNTPTEITVTNNGNGTFTIDKVGAGGGGTVALGPVAPQTDTTSDPSISIDKTGSGQLINLKVNGTDRFVVSQSGAITSGSIDYTQVANRPLTTVTDVAGASGAITLGSGLQMLGNQLSLNITPPSTAYINDDTVQQSANFNIRSKNAGFVGAIISGTTGQSANVLEVRANGVAAPTFAVTAGGVSLFQPTANSTSAFRIYNASASNLIFNVDTTNRRVGIGTNTPQYDLDVVGDINASNSILVGGQPVCTTSGCLTQAQAGQFIANTYQIDAGNRPENIALETGFDNQATATLQATATQTSNLLQLQNSSGNRTLALSTTGSIDFYNAAGNNRTSLTFATPTANLTITIPTSLVNGTDTLCLENLANCAGSGSGISGTGTSGTIALFNGATSLSDSIISQSSNTITVDGELEVTDAAGITIGVAGPAGTKGLLTFANATNANLVTIEQNSTAPSSNVSLQLPNTSGTLAVGVVGGGALSYDPTTGLVDCPSCLVSGGGGGTSGVTSVNTRTGAVVFEYVSYNGGTGKLEVQDASTTQKGVAQFNSTNFSASAGTINTVQNINSTATPTFASATLTGSSTLTLGTSSTNTGSIVFRNATNVNTITLQPATTGTAVLTLPAVAGGTIVAGVSGSGLSASGGLISLGTVPVGNGGTGATSFTSNGILYGNGSGTVQVTAAASSAGECLVSTAGAPVWGTCPGSGGASATLQNGYNNYSSSPAAIVLDNTRQALLVRDAATPISGNLLAVQSNDGASTYFAVSTAQTTIANLNISGLSAGVLKINGSGAVSSGSIGLATGDVSGTLPATSGGTGVNTYVAGDILYATAANTLGRLAIGGTNGQCLTVSSGAPAWGSCAGNPGSGVTLQAAYDNTNPARIVLNNTNGGFTLRDNATPITGNLFAIQNNAGGTNYLQVSTSGTTIAGTLNLAAISTAGVLKVDASGNVSRGTVALASASDVSGTLPIGNGGTGVTGTPSNGQLLIGNGAGYTLSTLTAGSARITITNSAGGISIDAPFAGSCSTCANDQLSNLSGSGTAINATLQPGAWGDAYDVGSGARPFREFFLWGTSSTNGASIKLTGVPTAARTLSLPDATGTVCISTNNCNYAAGSGSGNYIQNQNASVQTSSNFWISGTGRADSSLTTPLVDTATGVSLNVGTNNATQINLNKNTQVTGDITLATGATRTISVQTQSVSNTAGNQLNITGATGNGTGAGGAIALQAGTSGSGTIGNGGALNLYGGNAASTNGSGGSILLWAGQATGSGSGGNITLQSGSASSSGIGGALNLIGGPGGFVSGGSGGSINITGGAASSGNSNGGSVTITAGAKTGTGTGGQVIIKPNTAGDRTDFFQIQNAAGASIINTDTTTGRVQITRQPTSFTQTTEANTLTSTVFAPAFVYSKGYVYAITGSLANYARLNTDGSIGSWTSTTSPSITAALGLKVFSYGNYLIAVGDTVVKYTTVQDNGTLSAWKTTTSLPTSRQGKGVEVVNGYIYAFGGGDGSSNGNSDSYYAVINSNGSIGAWNTLSTIPYAAEGISAFSANGYMYITGGFSQPSTWYGTTYYASINANGTLGSWTATSTFGNARSTYNNAIILNGNVCILGGWGSGGIRNEIHCASFQSNGTLSAWSNSGTLINPNGGWGGAAIYINGNFYQAGGNSNLVYRGATTKLTVGGTLDLVGLSSGSFVGASSAGELIAGRTTVLGKLQVQADALVSGSLAVSKGIATSQLLVSGSTPTVEASNITAANADRVIVSGRYAYLTSTSFTHTLSVLDITPNIPVIRGTLTLAGTGTHPIAIAGNHAYILNTASNTMQIIDISNPSSPTSLVNFTVGVNLSDITVAGKYAYVVSSAAVRVIDVSNPYSPSIIATYSDNNISSVTVAGKYLYYTVSAASDYLAVLDISNPIQPTYVGQTNTNDGPKDIQVSGSYAYVINENANTLQIFNISNPASIGFAVGSIATGSSPRELVLAGRYAYVTNYSSNNLQVFDVSVPTSPTSVDTITTNNNPSGLSVTGGRAYVASWFNSKLQYFDISGAYIQALEVGTTETEALQVRTDARIWGGLSVQGAANIGGSVQVESITAYSDIGSTAGDLLLNTIAAPTAPTAAINGVGGYSDGGFTSNFVVTFVTERGESLPSANSNTISLTSNGVSITNIARGPKGVIARNIYWCVLGVCNLATTIYDNTSTNISSGSPLNSYSLGYENTSSGRIFSGNSLIMQATESTTILGKGAASYASGKIYGSVAVGAGALQFASRSDGTYNNGRNTAVGYQVLANSTSGNQNTAVGFQALVQNNEGDLNTAIGESALRANTIGSNNVAIGSSSGFQNTGGNLNTYIGSYSGYFDSAFYTPTSLVYGSAIGANALVQQNNSLILGRVGDGTSSLADGQTRVGIGTTMPDNAFSVSPVYYNTGTAYQSGTTVTGIGTSWNSSMVGMKMIIGGGSTNVFGTILSVNSPTSITLSSSNTRCFAYGCSYRIHSFGLNVDFTGNTFVQGSSSTLFTGKNNAGTNLFAIDGSTDYTTAYKNFGVNKVNGTQKIFSVNDQTFGNLISNPDFEGGTTGWTAISSTLSQYNQYAYLGNSTLRIDTTGANQGARTSVTLNNGSTYVLSFRAAGLGGVGTLKAGYSTDGTSGGEIDCVTNQAVAGIFTTIPYVKIECTFTTGTPSSPYIYIKNTDSGNRIYLIDAVTLNQTYSQEFAYGYINTRNSYIAGDLKISKSYSSDTAIQVESLTTTPIFNVNSVYGTVSINVDKATMLASNSVLTVGGNIGFSGDGGGTKGITIISQSQSNTAGQNLQLKPGNGNGNGVGGNLFLQGATGGATGAGGQVQISAGTGGVTSGNGGEVIVSGGNANGSGAGGGVTIYAGSASGTNQNGGDIILTSGAKTGTGTVGKIVIKPSVSGNRTDFFQIQTSGGTAFFTADSTNSRVTVTNLVVTASLTVNGHIISGNSSGTTTVAAGAAACTTPTVSVSGNDTAGVVTITTGTACAAGGTLATVTFANAYTSAPTVVLTPQDAASAGLQTYATQATGTFVLGTNTTATDTTTYKYNYLIIQ